MLDMIDLRKLNIKKIKEAQDEEFKEILLQLNTMQQNKLGTLSVYYSISGCLNIMYHIYYNGIFKKIKSEDERQLLEMYYEKIFNYLRNIDEMLKNNNILEELKDLRYKLEILITNIEPYILEVSCLEEKFDYYLAKKLIREENKKNYIDEIQIDNFINQVVAYLMEVDNEYEVFEERMSGIISYLPFRMTKEKFFVIVKNILKRNLSIHSKTFIDREIKKFKKIFDASMEPSFGTKYDDYFRKTQKLKKHKDLKYMTVEDLKMYSEKSKILFEEIENLSSFIKNMGVIVNKLISAFLISSINNHFNLDKNILSLWKKLSIKSEKDYDELSRALNKQISKLKNEMFEVNKFISNLIKESSDREDLIDEKFNEKLIFTNKVLTYYNDTSFLNKKILFYDEEESNIVDIDYLEEVLNNYIHFLNRSISSMSNFERKLRMRRLLFSLEISFDKPEDFISYIESSLDLRTTSKEEIIMAMDNILYMINTDSYEN